MKKNIHLISSFLLILSFIACNKKQEEKKVSAPMPYKVVQVSKTNTTLLANILQN